MSNRIYIVLLASAALCCLLFFFTDDALPRLRALRASLQEQREANIALSEKVSALDLEVYNLKNNPREIERAARKELGMARPDELIFYLENHSRNQQ